MRNYPKKNPGKYILSKIMACLYITTIINNENNHTKYSLLIISSNGVITEICNQHVL